MISFREKLKPNHPNKIWLNLVPAPIENEGERVTTLYPYHSTKFAVVFVYGKGAMRQTERIGLSGLQLNIQYGFLVFVLLAAAILCYIRRRNRLRRNGCMLCLIDVHVAFIGGGNLSMRHRFERWFFGIISIGAFFLLIFWMESIFYPSFLIRDQSIQTFEQLAKINPPIYIPVIIKNDEEKIEEMLR